MPPHPQRERARQLRRDGLPLSQIAEACGVTKVCVSKWCRDLPEHRAVTARNGLAVRTSQRVFPRGTEALNESLRQVGLPRTERLKIAREAAAAGVFSKLAWSRWCQQQRAAR